jgi:myo-inositol-1(or 4)-monophosphatase
MPRDVELQEICFTAIEAAKEAGHLIRMKIGHPNRLDTKSNPQDLVTEVDKACEEMIRNTIRKRYSDHEILGEESVAPGSEASSIAIREKKLADTFLWIIDPIDGTTNFVHGFPFCCVSIAVAYQGSTKIAVIYDPLHDELFTAIRGVGAFLNGQRIHVSDEQALSESLIATGFHGKTKGIGLKSLLTTAQRCRNVRTTGSAALHLAYVAAGRLSGFWEYDLNSWDLAAGCLLIEEAGGNVTDTDNQPFHLEVRNVVATNAHIHDELVSALHDARNM